MNVNSTLLFHTPPTHTQHVKHTISSDDESSSATPRVALSSLGEATLRLREQSALLFTSEGADHAPDPIVTGFDFFFPWVTDFDSGKLEGVTFFFFKKRKLAA